MMRRTYPRIFILVAILFSIAILSPSTQPLQAAEERVPVFGIMLVSNQAENCLSPIEICLSGTVRGNLLNGTISGQANDIREIDDRKGNPIAFILTGVGTITTPQGTLTLRSEFYQNYPALTGHGTMIITGGTKRYKHAKGIIAFVEPRPPATLDSVQTMYYQGWLSKDSGDR